MIRCVADITLSGTAKTFSATNRLANDWRHTNRAFADSQLSTMNPQLFPTNSRSMPLNGLTPGTQYQVQVRAIGGSTGYSDWSDTVSHMSM